MLLANPLHLRPVLQNPAYRGMLVVLLHESYPYTAQGAYLATVYENVYLDLSYGLPGIGYVEMREYTRTALAVAPFTKLMYSSDGAGIPELHWSSALAGRRAIGEALAAMVACDEITTGEAETAGALLLRENANRVYGLT
jgi:predicted TIM-barrel fold metal-dependent hydrolase